MNKHVLLLGATTSAQRALVFFTNVHIPFKFFSPFIRLNVQVPAIIYKRRIYSHNGCQLDSHVEPLTN